MSLRHAHDPDALFAEVEDVDLVLTHDGPLSQALNRRVRSPRLGRFAMTPRTWATGEFNPRDERRLFHAIVRETDLDWRDATFALSIILDCWDETGRADAVLEYGRFDRSLIRTALPVVQETTNARSRLANRDPPDDLDVAVIGREYLPTLDRGVVPPEARDVSPFADGNASIPPFRLHDSRTAVVEALVSNVDPNEADRVAVVMDRDGPFPALVETAFETAGIPYHGGPGFGDDPALRTCIAIARAARETDRLRLTDLRGIVRECGIEPDPTDLEKRVIAMDEPALRPLTEFLRTVEDRTFDELVSTVEEWSGESLETCRAELELLGLRDRAVTPELVDDFAYYLQSFDVPVEREDRGVVLVDASSASSVDRSVVYHLGMDVEWTRPVADRPWIDRERRDQENLDRFQLLLQSGQRQVFLVHEHTGGKPVVPCLYFQDLIGDDFRTFADHDHRRYGRPPGPEPASFPHVPIQAPPDPPRTLSQSKLNTLANCPLDYCFDQLVETPDRDYFRKGTLFHDFAELYVNHPKFVERMDREELVDEMLAAMEPFVDASSIPGLATEFRIGTAIIERFLRERPPTIQSYDGYRANFWSNSLADAFDRRITTPVTEQWFQNTEIGISGVVDLILSPDCLIDYKSGRSRSVRQIIERSAVDPVHEKPDFQAVLYLAHHRQVVPDQPIDFVFFHFLDVLDEAVAGEYALDNALVRVRYDPRSFASFAASREAYDAVIGDVAESNPRRKTLERWGYDGYRAFISEIDLPDVRSPEAVLQTPLAEACRAELLDAVGDYQYVRDGCASALKTLYGLRAERIFPEDVDAFEDFVAHQHEALDEYHRSGFPVGDPNEDRLRHRDMVRIHG